MKAITPKTRLIALTHVSSNSGDVFPAATTTVDINVQLGAEAEQRPIRLSGASVQQAEVAPSGTSYIFTGAVLIETIFAWPGMGRLYYQAAVERDYPLLMAVLIIGAAFIILSNLLADILYAYLDPRVRYE